MIAALPKTLESVCLMPKEASDRDRFYWKVHTLRDPDNSRAFCEGLAGVVALRRVKLEMVHNESDVLIAALRERMQGEAFPNLKEIDLSCEFEKPHRHDDPPILVQQLQNLILALPPSLELLSVWGGQFEALCCLMIRKLTGVAPPPEEMEGGQTGQGEGGVETAATLQQPRQQQQQQLFPPTLPGMPAPAILPLLAATLQQQQQQLFPPTLLGMPVPAILPLLAPILQLQQQ
uniref:Uncharacterized protein n=1 Tax=Chromera velia CCMP2878 TaxID=1169474 RepID=A0A0G4I022_9ALVE|eukprot:Cvel_9829.t1-p1 / transcript=Cvel_9829.t1 / gene=Cvel_9829 / organism=Chromera_velia_CCMP2878 / gene_product=hypothetical protein / transcript_product=hypothetical protein / location=Cvel_scaffold578:1140-2291(+) / protein_length=232 / sequence_SO=supercontig / SO=protein_coding / is_pseudo=false